MTTTDPPHALSDHRADSPSTEPDSRSSSPADRRIGAPSWRELTELARRLEALDADVATRWDRSLLSGDPELTTVLADAVRHIRHARLALIGRGIG